MQNLLILAFLLFEVSCSKSQLEWISPSAGDAYHPGSSIVGKWSADKAVVSPSLKLCLGSSQSSMNRRDPSASSGSCGDKVYPTVQQDNGVYSISLSIPNTSSVDACYLLIEDDFGNSYRSPSFSVSTSAQSDTPEESHSVSPSVPNDQAPLGVSKAPATPAVTVTTVPIPTTAPDTSPSPDSIYATRRSPPTAAFAVPLSIIGAILLVAGGLCVRHNRKIQEERARDVEKLDLERKRSLSADSLSKKSTYSRQSDIEQALHVLSKHDLTYSPKREAPVPLFMPAEFPSRREREPRRNTKEPYGMRGADTYTQHQRHRSRVGSAYSVGYSEQSDHKMSMPIPAPSYYEPSVTVCPSSRAPSVRSKARPFSRGTIDSQSYASSPTTARYPEYHVSSRPQSRASRVTASSRPYLPPIITGAPLYSHREEHGEGHVTDSVLDDYLLPSPYDPPPECLMPAPQRLHVRNTFSDAPARVEEEMEEVDLYDAVADNLRKGYTSGR